MTLPSSRMQALGVYAKQANDDELIQIAKRIQGRAVHRVGALLREMPALHPGPRSQEEIDDGSVIYPPTRSEAAREAGVSERQQTTALRVATFTEDEVDGMMSEGESVSSIASSKSSTY